MNFENILITFLKEIEDLDLNELDLDDIAIRIPHFHKELILDICKKAEELFKNEETLITMKSMNCYVVGDLHGNLFDVLRIIKKIGFPIKDAKIVFLGDIVDRGEFSIETVLIIYIMKIIYPNNVFIIRGNHEFDSICNEFKEEILSMYDLDTYNSFINSFSYLPLSVLINNQVFCIHGGIGPNITSINQIKEMQRPIFDFHDNDTLISLLWSDPEESIDEFKDSYRGMGHIFGCNAFKRFMKNNEIQLMLRGHECVENGYQFLFGERLITVFSASKYGGCAHNSSGIIQLINGVDPIAIEFKPIEYVKRDMVTFYDL